MKTYHKDESGRYRHQRFISIVKQSYRQLLRRHTAALCVLFLVVLTGGILLAGLLEWAFYLPAWLKTVLVIAFPALGGGLAWYLYRQLRRPTYKEFYSRLGRSSGLPQLTDALDLYYETDAPSSLQKAAIEQNLDHLATENVSRKADSYLKSHRFSRLLFRGAAGFGAVLLLLAAFTAYNTGAIERLGRFWVSYEPPNPYSYTIEPGTVTLEQGESFTPVIRFNGSFPDNLTLAFKTEIEKDFRERNARSTGDRRAEFTPVSLTTDGQYYFTMDGFRSEEHRVTVQLRPRFEQLELQVIPPAYTQLDTSSYSYPFPKIQPYRGSEIALQGKTNKPVSRLTFKQAGTDTAHALARGALDSTFSHRWSVHGPDTLSFEMADSAGLSNKNKFRFVVAPAEDQPPFVELIEPSENMKMKTPEKLQIRYEAGDDFGLTSASLQFDIQRAFAREAEHGSVSLSPPPMNRPEAISWDLPALDPKPRDVITYWIEVKDNDGYRGAKTGQSQKLTITIPSMTEYLDELESKESDVSESLENISESFDQMEQEYEKFKEQLRRNPETSWEQKQTLDRVSEEQKKIDKQVQELNSKFEQIRKEMEKSRVMSPETMKAYDELQKLMKEINDPELAKALEELQKSLGEMNPDQLRKALENYEFNEEQYRERIKRTMELFKSLKLNSDLEKMATALEELAEQEKEVSESERSPARQLKQQETIRKDLKEVEQQIRKLKNNSPEKAREQVEQLQKESTTEMKEIRRKLQENIQQLREQQNQPKTAPDTKQQQRQIQQQMQQMAKQARAAKQQLNRQQRRINMAALEYILYSLINLSDNQEELTKETEDLPSRSQAFVEKARKEQNIRRQFSALSDSLFQVSSEVPSFSNQINRKKNEVENELSRAVELLSERDKSNSTFAQRHSLGGINELASMIASLLDQIQNQQSAGSGGAMSMQQFMEQLKQMSGYQQKLNQQIQDMINDIQGNRLTRDQMDRLNQLSRQQNRIRKQIRELQRRGDFESGDRVLSELERMSEEMEDAINDLRGGQLDRRLMKRQQNILSRMLSAEKAVQERGEEERRKATTAEEKSRSAPPDITLEELQKRIRKMLNNPERTKFAEDYQRLIEQYFELLKEREKELDS